VKTKRFTKVMGALGLAAGLALGAAGIAAAATGTSSSPSATPTTAQSETAPDQQNQQDPTLNGSVQASDPAGSGESSDAALQPLAKITPEQAKQAALAAVPGTVNKVTLENENGSVVYGVEITAGGTVTDVKVDAGTGKVLAQDSGNDAGKGETGGQQAGTEKPETGESATGDTAD
jgi:uncharacterized membrane protein YkoI